MKFRLATLTLTLLLSACATSEKMKPDSWRDQNRAKFTHLLERHEGKKAAPFALIFDGSQAEDHPLLAQLNLFLCQPEKAEIEIKKIADPKLRDLFQAVLLGLVSQDEKSVTETDEPSKKHKLLRPDPRIIAKLPLAENEEIWGDEWDDLKLSHPAQCEMPRIVDLDMRKTAELKARTYFEKLPLEAYLKDFSIVVLAMDANAPIPYRKEILSYYSDLKETTEYQKFESLDSNTSTPEKKLYVIAQNSKSAEINLSELDLSIFESHHLPQAIPLLLEMKGVQP